MEQYFKFKFFLDMISLFCGVLAVITIVGVRICDRKGITDDIIEDKYKFKLKHTLLLPSILVMMVINKRV